MNDTQRFIGHCGISMMQNQGFYFANRFDWIMMRNYIQKNTLIPRTIYIKTDYLMQYLPIIMSIQSDFILVSGCSDYSPQIHCYYAFMNIINHRHLIKWYSENNLSNHPKMYSLTVGFATHTQEYETNLLRIRCIRTTKIDKVFCCWRERNSNCCGESFVERGEMTSFIHEHPEIFDIYEPRLSETEYQHKISSYKWCLCPLGNGIDASPKLLECLFLKTIPIVRKNHNVMELYKNYPVIWVDEFTDILQMKLAYDENIDWDNIMNQFTCDYWVEKITNTI